LIIIGILGVAGMAAIAFTLISDDAGRRDRLRRDRDRDREIQDRLRGRRERERDAVLEMENGEERRHRRYQNMLEVQLLIQDRLRGRRERERDAVLEMEDGEERRHQNMLEVQLQVDQTINAIRRGRQPVQRQLTQVEKASAASAISKMVENKSAIKKTKRQRRKARKKEKRNSIKLIEEMVTKRKDDADGLIEGMLVRNNITSQATDAPSHKLLYEGRFNRVPCEVREYPPCKRTIYVLVNHTTNAATGQRIRTEEKYTVWFPHTVFVRKWSADKEAWVLHLSFASSSIENEKDKVWFPFIPNVYKPSGRMCTSGGENFDSAIKIFWESQFITAEIPDGIESCYTTFGSKNFKKNMELWESLSLEEVIETMTKVRSRQVKAWTNLRKFKVGQYE